MVSLVPLDSVQYPPRCKPGDRVALVSPSAGLPGMFPHVHELGVRRLIDDFGLVPVEYETTRRMNSSPEDRAADLMRAFRDPSIRVIMATIGGDDQITILRHLDPAVIAENQKPFFGYSDNTNLLNYMLGLGVVSFHGGSTMVHLGRSGRMHERTTASLRAALFEGGMFDFEPVDRFAVNALPWDDPTNLETEAPTYRASPCTWHGDPSVVEGRLWGGCLEILDWTFQVGRYVGPTEYYLKSLLFIETSEEMPSAEYVYRTLRNLGERGVLEAIAGLVVARPASEPFGTRATDEEILEFENSQRDAILRVTDRYHPGLPIVIGIDAGHTDPQLILPIGGIAKLDCGSQTFKVRY